MAARRKRSPASAPVAAPPTLLPPRFVVPVPDSPVELEHPVEHAGKVYRTIIRRRPSSGVLGRWFEQFDADAAPAPGEPHLNVPIFVHPDGDLVPDAVLGFLDDDDKQRVYEGTDPFLPARLMVALEALTQDSPPSGGGPAELTSSVSSAAAAPNSTP